MIGLYPYARVFDTVTKGVGPFQLPGPQGITIHYTAGGRASSSIEYLRSTQLAYHLIIDRCGTVYQMVYLTDRVYHAGKAEWYGSPNKWHLGVALASYGKCEKKGDKYYTAYGTEIDDRKLTYTTGLKGEYAHWEKVTEAQYESLKDVCLWAMKNFNIMPSNICGHDEAAPTRKIDPGGIMEPVKVFRRKLALWGKS